MYMCVYMYIYIYICISIHIRTREEPTGWPGWVSGGPVAGGEFPEHGSASGMTHRKRERDFPRTSILPNIFDGRERLGEARGSGVMGENRVFPRPQRLGAPIK